MYLLSFIILLVSCTKTTNKTNELTGEWELVKTELYKNNNLDGILAPNEITTYYQFDNCNENEPCQLQIKEDGEIWHYTYTLITNSNQLIIDEQNYIIEYIDQQQLTLKKIYAPYTSVYSFRKVI